MELNSYEENSLLRVLLRILVYVIVVISAAWFTVYSFMNQTVVSGNSMLPVLEADDMCLIDRLCYDLSTPKRFDIVLFERADTGKQNIKRIIGLPGETVQIINGQVYINGEVLDNPYTSRISLAGIAENQLELSDDEYFVLGDNADSSEDSRFSNIGIVTESAMKGKLWLIVKPFSRFGKIE